MQKATNKIIKAIEHGDSNQIHQFLEHDLLNESPDNLYDISQLLLQFGYLNEANQVLEHLQYLFPTEAQIAIDRASVLIELEKEDEALQLLMDVDPESEEYPQSLLVLADYYQMQGLYEVAEQRINEAIQILPNEPLLQFAKAELLYEIGRFVEASRIYEELYERQEKIAGVLLVERLAEVHRVGGSFEQSLEYYTKALEEKVTPDLLFGSAYCAFQLEKYDFSIKQLENLKELDPDYFSAYLLLAQSYSMIEDNQNAYRVIKEGLKRDEYDKNFYLFAGKIALKNGLPDEAIPLLQQAITLDPEYMEALLVLMSIYSKEERYDEIIELYENLTREHFDWSTLYPFVAEAYQKNEQYERAYEIYNLAYNDFKEDSLFLEKYCYFLLEYGKRDKAKIIAERLVSLEPTEEKWLDLLYTFE